MRINVALFLAIVAIASAAVGYWRFSQFGLLELTGDQAFNAQWIMRLAEAERILPVSNGGNWLSALMTDEESLLNILLRQVYQAQTLIFTVVSVGLFAILTIPFPATMETVVAVSIFFSAAALFCIAIFPTSCSTGRSSQNEAFAIGLVAFALGAMSSFFNIFSIMGPHNGGVFFLVLGAIFTQRWLSKETPSHSKSVQMYVFQCLAVYAHYTNVFLIGPATVIALLLHTGRSWRSKFVAIAWYVGITALTLIPAIALALVYSEGIGGGGNTQTFVGMTKNYVVKVPGAADVALLDRAQLWLEASHAFYSIPGLLLGIAGVIGLALREKQFFPVTFVFTHFLIGIGMLIFSQYDRTIAYLIPFLCLGGAWCLVTIARLAAIGKTWTKVYSGMCAAVASLAVLICTALHIQAETPRIETPTIVPKWGSLAKPPAWRPAMRNVMKRLSENGVLIPWNYGLSHQYRSLRIPGDKQIHLMRPMETLISHRKANTLRDYIENRSLQIRTADQLYILAPISINATVISTELVHLFGVDGFRVEKTPTIIAELSWPLPREKHLELGMTLYRIDWR